jgi:hypothetical protein
MRASMSDPTTHLPTFLRLCNKLIVSMTLSLLSLTLSAEYHFLCDDAHACMYALTALWHSTVVLCKLLVWSYRVAAVFTHVYM